MDKREAFVAEIAQGLESLLLSTADVITDITELDDSKALIEGEETNTTALTDQISEMTETLNRVCAALHGQIDAASKNARLSRAPYHLILAEENIKEAIALQHFKNSF